MIKIIDEKMIDCIELLVKNELARAMEQYGKFNSVHEAYAVIKEEIEELKEQVQFAENSFNALWHYVKNDNYNDMAKCADSIIKYGIQIAAEAIQVAAMGKKLMEYLEGEKCKSVKN